MNLIVSVSVLLMWFSALKHVPHHVRRLATAPQSPKLATLSQHNVQILNSISKLSHFSSSTMQVLRVARYGASRIGRISTTAPAFTTLTPQCASRQFSTRSALLNNKNMFNTNSEEPKQQKKQSGANELESDEPEPQSQKKNRKRFVFLGLCALMPIISGYLGTWQVKRLQWKVDKIADCENRLLQEPLPLPGHITEDQEVLEREFEYRKVVVTGTLYHDEEFLVGPRMKDSVEGYFLVTPLDRSKTGGSKLLIKRGWISKEMADQKKRDPLALPKGEVSLVCLLRPVPLKNMFTPDSPTSPSVRIYNFMDIPTMSKFTGAQNIYLEEELNMRLGGHEWVTESHMMNHGVPIGKLPKVDLRNTHLQYIATWYGVCVFTTVMLVIMWRKGRMSTLDKKVAYSRKYVT